MQSSDHKQPLSPSQRMISACAGALFASVIITPFDVVKTRIQADQKLIGNERIILFRNCALSQVCPICAHGPSVCEHKMTMSSRSTAMETALNIARSEGKFALWTGLSPTLMMVVPATMIYYAGYDIIKDKIALRLGTHKDIFAPMIAGSTARTTAVLILSPFELIRTKIQAQERYTYKEMTGTIRNAVKQNGVLSLWRGLGPTLLRDVPFSACYWAGYEYWKRKLSKSISDKNRNFNNFAAGALSGSIVAAATTPFDVVKTRLQVDMGENFAENRKIPSTWSVIRDIWKLHGWNGLFAGLSARIAKITPVCAIMIGSYEFCKDLLAKRNDARL